MHTTELHVAYTAHALHLTLNMPALLICNGNSGNLQWIKLHV